MRRAKSTYYKARGHAYSPSLAGHGLHRLQRHCSSRESESVMRQGRFLKLTGATYYLPGLGVPFGGDELVARPLEVLPTTGTSNARRQG